jgi:signal peptidase I
MKTAGQVLLVALIVAGGLAFFALDFPRQPSNDMAPGLRKGDLVLACRVCGSLQRGDVVLLSAPKHPEQLLLRRIVAVPGDRVEVKVGRVLVNGEPLPAEKPESLTVDGIDALHPTARVFESTLETLGAHRYHTLRDPAMQPAGERPVETLVDSYFVLADRRTLAADSRDYGPVKRSAIRSRALRVLSAGDGDTSRQTRLP